MTLRSATTKCILIRNESASSVSLQLHRKNKLKNPSHSITLIFVDTSSCLFHFLLLLFATETRVKLESDTRRGVEGDERARRPVRSRRRKLKEYWGVEAVDVV